MKDFILAILPAVAILLTFGIVFWKTRNITPMKREQNYNEVTGDYKNPIAKIDYSTEAMIVGIIAGALLGFTGILPARYGVSFGILLGMIVGSLIKRKNPPEDDNPTDYFNRKS